LATLQYNLPPGIVVDSAAVPEPGMWAMIATAAACFGLNMRRRRMTPR
jgi:hypothetical protein